MSVSIQFRRDTSANWTSVNPILAVGELGLVTDDLSYKIGDGSTAWNSLPARNLTGVFGSALTLSAVSRPSAPSAGTMALWAQSVGGRLLPRIMGPSGLDTSLQPAMWGNGFVLVGPNASTAFTVLGAATPTVVGTASTPALTTGTNMITATRRTLVTSAATANSASEIRLAATPLYRGEVFGSVAVGGFFVVMRHNLASTTALQRTICGITSASTAISTSQDPAALTNCIFLGNGSSDANMQIMYNDGTGTCSKIDLGSNFPSTNVAATYELALFCKPNGDEVNYKVTRLDTGDEASGTLTTDLPSKTTLLYPHMYANNGGTAAAVLLNILRLYIETDN